MALQRTIQGTGSGTYTYATIAPPDPQAQASDFNALLPDGATAVAPGHRSITLNGVAVSPTTRDTVLLGPNHYSVQVSTNDAKTFTVALAHKYDVHSGAAPNLQTASRAQLVELGGLSLSQGETLTVWSDGPLGQIGLSNSGAAKQVSINATSLDLATGKPIATHSSEAAIDSKTDFALSVADWRQAGAITVTRKQGQLNTLAPANFQKPRSESLTRKFMRDCRAFAT